MLEIADACAKAQNKNDVDASLDSLARLARFDSLDKFLTAVADCGEAVLVEMKCPGCEFLPTNPAQEAKLCADDTRI